MAVAACGDQETTTTTQAVTTTSQAAVTTMQAAVNTTQPSGPTVALAADRKSKLDEFLSQLEKNNKMMGGVVIAQDGQVVYENYVGASSLAEDASGAEQSGQEWGDNSPPPCGRH